MYDLPPDPSPRAWTKVQRGRRARAGLKGLLASPPFTLGEIIRNQADERRSTAGLHLLEPGDCFELEWADTCTPASSR